MSALLTLALFALAFVLVFGLASVFDIDPAGGRALAYVIFLIGVPFLIFGAYPPGWRRWYRWMGYELCVLLPIFIWLAHPPSLVDRDSKTVAREGGDGRRSSGSS